MSDPIEAAKQALWDAWPWLQDQGDYRDAADLMPEPIVSAILAYLKALRGDEEASSLDAGCGLTDVIGYIMREELL